MEFLDPEIVINLLQHIYPEHEGTEKLFLDLHDIITSSDVDLKTLLTNHANYVKQTESDLPCNNDYCNMFEIYYYGCLYDLTSKYTLDEIYSVINSIPEYDNIDKIFFKVLFKTITLDEGCCLLDKETQPDKLLVIKKNESLVIKCRSGSESDVLEKIIPTTQHLADYFKDSKLEILKNLFFVDRRL